MAELDLTDIRADHPVAWAKRAVLLTDIVGSVGLIEQDEVGVISHWLDFVERVKRDILPPNNGRLVKSLGMVNSTPQFHDHPKVINGYSDLMKDIFGDAGVGARSAVGMVALPAGIAVEIEAIFQVKE